MKEKLHALVSKISGRKTDLALAALILVAVLLGVKIMTGTNTNIDFSGFKNAILPEAAKVSIKSGSPAETQEVGESISIMPPAEDSDQKEKDAYMSAMLGIGAREGKITLSSCKANPPVFILPGKKPVVMHNTDGNAETIIIGRSQKISLGAGEEKEVIPDFYGQGAYGYRCEFSSDLAGVFIIQ